MRQRQKQKGMVIKMRKRTRMFGLLMILVIGLSTTVNAAEADKTVTLTDDNKMIYTDGNADIGNAFSGMAPGDTRTVTIRVQNENEHAASFFVSQETLNYLEEKENASGGAYSYQLKVGTKNDNTATTLLSAVAGGYDDSLTADKQGLKGITELQDYQYLAELKQGEYTNVYLTLTIDGEGFDSTDAVNYENATGELAFRFRAYYQDREPVIVTDTKVIKGSPTIVVMIKDKVVTLVGSAKTGDPVPVAGLLVVLLTGLGLILLAFKKRKGESQA